MSELNSSMAAWAAVAAHAKEMVKVAITRSLRHRRQTLAACSSSTIIWLLDFSRSTASRSRKACRCCWHLARAAGSGRSHRRHVPRRSNRPYLTGSARYCTRRCARISRGRKHPQPRSRPRARCAEELCRRGAQRQQSSASRARNSGHVVNIGIGRLGPGPPAGVRCAARGMER